MTLRFFGIVALVGVAGLAFAQSSLLGAATKVAKASGMVKGAVNAEPLQASGFPVPGPKDDRLPPPQPVGEEEKKFKILHAGKTSRLGQRVSASGGVHATYQGYDILAEELEGNLDTQVFELKGNVSLVGSDTIVEGEKVQVNFKSRSFRAYNADVQIHPQFLQGRVKDDVYVKGGTSYGTRREVFGEETSFTTCNLEDPHFSLVADRTDLRPGKRAIFRDVRIRLLGHTILGLPYLSIPLEERNQRYTPEVGQSPDEGYFVKFTLPVPLKTNTSFLDTNLDYYTKLGNGFGARFQYDNASSRGNLRAYGILGRSRTFEFQGNHEQRLGTSTFLIDTNLQRQNYLNAPENTFWTTRASFRVPQKTATSTLSYFRTSNESDDFRYLQQVWTLSDQRRPTSRTTTTLDVALTSNETVFGGSQVITREQADVRFRGQHDLSKAIAQVEYQRAIPVGETTNFFSSSDRTPVVTLSSDARRLFGNRMNLKFPFQTELSLGEFGNPGGTDRITRSHFDFNFSKYDSGSGRFGVGYDGRYTQGVYSDDTAQYSLAGGTTLRYSLGRDTGVNLRYYYLQPHGFTPLSFDRGGRSNLASGDISVRSFRSLRFGLQSGYDFLLEERSEVAWQTFSLRSEWTPAPWFAIRGLSTYDPFSHVWSNHRFDLSYRAGATFVSAGARYDGFRHTWGNLNFYVDGFKWGRLKTSALIAYNGYLKQFEARHFSFTYDLHCAEAIFQIVDNPVGFRPGTQFYFFIRVKAFPFATPFGTGQRGAPIGTGTGEGF